MRSPETNRKTVVAFGDSLTYGFPYQNCHSWVEILSKATGWRIYNAGVNGDTFVDMYRRISKDVFAYCPQMVIVMAGTNDVYLGFSQSQIKESFLAVMEKLNEYQTEIWLGLPPPVADSTEKSLQMWRCWLLDYAKEYNLGIIDFYSDFLTTEGRIKQELLIDGCHPRREGYDIMGQRAVKTMHIDNK